MVEEVHFVEDDTDMDVFLVEMVVFRQEFQGLPKSLTLS